jgi:hypothetical protein
MATGLKTAMRLRPSWVRIPCPPLVRCLGTSCTDVSRHSEHPQRLVFCSPMASAHRHLSRRAARFSTAKRQTGPHLSTAPPDSREPGRYPIRERSHPHERYVNRQPQTRPDLADTPVRNEGRGHRRSQRHGSHVELAHDWQSEREDLADRSPVRPAWPTRKWTVGVSYNCRRRETMRARPPRSMHSRWCCAVRQPRDRVCRDDPSTGTCRMSAARRQLVVSACVDLDAAAAERPAASALGQGGDHEREAV